MRSSPDDLRAGRFLRWARLARLDMRAQGACCAGNRLDVLVLVAGEGVRDWLASHRLRYTTFSWDGGRNTVKYFNPWLARLVRVYDGWGAAARLVQTCVAACRSWSARRASFTASSSSFSASPAAPCPGSPAGRTRGGLVSGILMGLPVGETLVGTGSLGGRCSESDRGTCRRDREAGRIPCRPRGAPWFAYKYDLAVCPPRCRRRYSLCIRLLWHRSGSLSPGRRSACSL